MNRATILLASRGDANKETTKGASTVAWHRSFSSSSLKKIVDQVRGFRCRIHSSPDFLPRSCPCVASSHFCLDNLSPIVTLELYSIQPIIRPRPQLSVRNSGVQKSNTTLDRESHCPIHQPQKFQKALEPSTHRPLFSARSPSFPGSCERFAKQLEQRSTS